MISVIVPVYNIEKYICQAIQSLTDQTYKDLEIICVDDGSTDGSGEICDEYAKKDPRIRVIHQENRGAAAAKNTALQYASGQYLAFMDSDDVLEPDAYEYMLELLEKTGADVVQCGFRDFYKERTEEHGVPDQIFSGEEYLKRFTSDWTCGLLWNKLYKRSLFQNVRFEEGHKIDDEFFTDRGLMRAHKVASSSKTVYNYRQRLSGAMRNALHKQKIVMDRLEYLDKRRRDVVSEFPSLKQDYDYHYLSMLVILAQDIGATPESIRLTKEQLERYFKEEKNCKMEWTLKGKLWRLRHDSVEKVLSRKAQESPVQNREELFE